VLLALTTGLFWAALYVYVPVLPVHAEQLGASLSAIGLLVGVYGVGQLLLRVPIGVLSDRDGRRRPFVAGGLVCAGLAGVALALATDPAGLILGRALSGVAAAAWVAFAVLFASYFAPARATYAISLINFVNQVATACATYGGSLLAQAQGVQASFWGAAVLSGLGLVTLLGVRERPLTRAVPLTMRGVARVARTPLLVAVASAAVIGTAINHATSFGFIPVYATQLGASRADLGALTAARLVPFALATLGTAWLAERAGSRLAVVSGTLVTAAATFLIPWAPNLGWLAVLQALGGIGFGLSGPILMGLSIRAVPNEERATAMGVYQATYALGMIAGPWAAGWVAELAGLHAVFVAAGGLALLSVVLVAATVPKR
jgi:MFS family permease